jgi:hypothetical protein
MDVADLFLPLRILKQLVIVCWIYDCECKQRMCFGWWPYCKWTHLIHTDHDPGLLCHILLIWLGTAHTSCVFAPSLSFEVLDNRNIDYPCSMSSTRPCYARAFSLSVDKLEKWIVINQFSIICVRPGHVMVFLIVCSYLLRMKQIFMVPGQNSLLLVSMIEEHRSYFLLV